ncbi:MAG TPA: hypothetical protein VF133_14680 [Terriglobales bacterium]
MGAQVIPQVEDERIAQLHRSFLRIAEVSLALTGDSAGAVHLERELKPFLSPPHQPEFDIEVSVEWIDHLQPARGVPVFDSGAVWSLFHRGRELVFDFRNSTLSLNPYKRLLADPTFRFAQLYLNRELLEKLPSVSALEYPADELLFTNYLAFHGLGVEVHGCGLIDADHRGHLFLGHSGAGKSTTARLWESFHKPTILSDDRIILRLHEGELWMYGTPWHGEAAFACPGKAKLHEIFILQHGTKNCFAPTVKARAAGELFARCFPPFHSALGLEHTIEFLNRVVDAVPCFDFQFVPDRSAVETVLQFRGAR